jgi:tetratricopeptide (TPR) repeat protein
MEFEDIFTTADQLLFKEGKPEEASRLYQSILDSDPNNVDAINSVAYCIKFKAKSNLASKYDVLVGLYQRSLAIDNDDVEANFNIGLLYL